jgi:glycerophosphoryl diester phosphodiesterase
MTQAGVEIIGHRGYAARFPENTLPSLIAALDAGATSVEFDVRVAACGTPVLFHDETLERTTDGRGPVASHPLGELRMLDAGAWFHPRFKGTAVPTLEEALRVTLGRPDGPRARRVYVEVKAVRERRDLERILDLVRKARFPDRVVMISLDFALLDALRHLDARIPLGYVVADEAELAEALVRVRSDARALLDPDQRILRSDPVRTSGWIEEGIRLVTWTVNEELHARELLALGVRRLTTDEPGSLLPGVARVAPRGA